MVYKNVIKLSFLVALLIENCNDGHEKEFNIVHI